MRIHIYQEEMTDEVELLTKSVPQGEGVLETFYGIRFWLKSPKEILDHSTPEDDDRNAVTFWVRASGLIDLFDMFNGANVEIVNSLGELKDA